MEVTTSTKTDNPAALALLSLTDIDTDQIFDQCIQRKNEILSYYYQSRTNLFQLTTEPYLYYFDKEISTIIKHYLIFLRNTMLEVHKAHVKKLSNTASSEDWDRFKQDSKRHVDLITQEFEKNVTNKWEWIQKSKNREEIEIESQLILSPGNIYAEQIELCGEQMARIKNQDIAVAAMTIQINELREDLETHLKEYINQEETLEKLLSHLDDNLKESKDVQEILIETKNHVQDITVTGGEEVSWLDELEVKISKLPKLKLITTHSNGLLLEKNLDLAKGTKKWVDMILLPQHIQLRDQVEQNLNRVCTMLVNAQHKYQLLEGKKNRIYHDEILKTIHSLAETQITTTHTIHQAYNDLISKVSSHLRSDQLYLDQNWMISTYDLTLGQLRSDTENIFKKVYDWTKNYISEASWIPFLNYNDGLHQTEKLAHLVQSKTIPLQPGHYQRVFMSDGFLSDYYLVERDKEMNQVAELEELWSSGFGTSLVITGMPLCGKSTFAFQIAEKFWPNNSVFLKPNSSIKINGKKIQTKTNIYDTLQSISKEIKRRNRQCIIIDDVYLWRDDETSLFENMKGLQSYILGLNPNIMIVAIINFHLLSRLQTLMRFKDAFMSHIDVSFLGKKSFLTTLGHRHDATQIELLGPKGEQLTEKQIEGIGKRIWDYTSKNVGSSLNEWIRSISQTDDGKWEINFSPHRYPQVVNEKNAAIFNLMLLYSTLEEEKLESFTGQMDFNVQQSVIYSMLNTRIFALNSNQRLAINTGVSTELQYQYNDLDEHEYNRYVLESGEIGGDKKQLLSEIKEQLFHFPFLSHESEVSIRERNNRFYITLLTMEPPSTLIEYLNDYNSLYQFQFIKRVKL